MQTLFQSFNSLSYHFLVRDSLVMCETWQEAFTEATRSSQHFLSKKEIAKGNETKISNNSKKTATSKETTNNTTIAKSKRFRPRWALRPCRVADRLVLLYSQSAYRAPFNYDINQLYPVPLLTQLRLWGEWCLVVSLWIILLFGCL